MQVAQAQLAANLDRVLALNHCQGIGKIWVLAVDYERAAVTGELDEAVAETARENRPGLLERRC